MAKRSQASFQESGMTILDARPLDPTLKAIWDVTLDSKGRVEMATRVAVKAFWMDMLKDDIFNVLFNILFPVFLCIPRKERMRRNWAV